MSDDGPVVNITLAGDLAKPASMLIEKISSAVGVMYEPRRIRQNAKALADAKIIEAKGDVEVSEIQRRAATRWLEEETTHQVNMEAVTALALPDLEESARPEDVDDDWISNFFDKCRRVSDEQMRKIWGRLLAAEANQPGSFTKRTVNLLASIEKKDAEQIQNVFGYTVFGKEGSRPLPLIYDLNHQIYLQSGLGFAGVSDLESIGVVKYAENGLSLPAGNFVLMHYFGQTIRVGVIQGTIGNWGMGHVMLTAVGAELGRIVEPVQVDGFTEYLENLWLSRGYAVEIEGT